MSDPLSAQSDAVERVASALLREYGWGPLDPTRGGSPTGLAGWELVARVALAAAQEPGGPNA